MLQRKQSLYLFVVFILSVLLFTGPLAFISVEDGGLLSEAFRGFRSRRRETGCFNLATYCDDLYLCSTSILYDLILYEKAPADAANTFSDVF